jgi:hypothetical protein
MARRGPIEPGTVGWEAQHCRECGKPFARVAPRNIVEITVAHLKSLVGRYCGVTCALSAYDRGIPRHH